MDKRIARCLNVLFWVCSFCLSYPVFTLRFYLEWLEDMEKYGV